MASIYTRPDSTELWISCYPQLGGPLVRCSTATDSPALAKKIRQKTELLIKLRRLSDVTVPKKVLAQLEPSFPQITAPVAPVTPGPVDSQVAAPAAPEPILRRSAPSKPDDQLTKAVRSYLVRATTSNAGHSVADKTSRLRQFFGSAFIDQLDPRPITPQIERAKERSKIPPWYRGGTLAGITPDTILEFFLTKNYSKANKRHFRELFFGLFRSAMINGIYVPANPYSPNPAAELPSYKGRTEAVTVLTDEDIRVQLAAVSADPRIKFGIQAMIEEGLRLHEILVVRREHVAADLSRLQLILPERKSKDDVGLKTGERTITIREEFRPILRAYLDSSPSDWLVPSSSDEQWNSDGFGEALHRLNRKAGLAWTSQDYRHTFATTRLSEGWNLKTLADEMGTSMTMLMGTTSGTSPRR